MLQVLRAQKQQIVTSMAKDEKDSEKTFQILTKSEMTLLFMPDCSSIQNTIEPSGLIIVKLSWVELFQSRRSRSVHVRSCPLEMSASSSVSVENRQRPCEQKTEGQKEKLSEPMSNSQRKLLIRFLVHNGILRNSCPFISGTD
jgi:hypothetical protein